jgi:hypothetical protein
MHRQAVLKTRSFVDVSHSLQSVELLEDVRGVLRPDAAGDTYTQTRVVAANFARIRLRRGNLV